MYIQTLAILTAVLAATATFAQEPASVTEAIAPFLDAQTIAIAHLNLEDVEIAPAVGELLRHVAANGDQRPSAETIANEAQDWLRQVRAAGAEHLFVVVSITDLPDGGPFLVAAFGEEGNPVQIAQLLGHSPNATPRSTSPFPVVDHFGGGAVVAGDAKTVERVKQQVRGGKHPAPSPHLTSALTSVQDAAVQLVVTPSDDHRRVVREMLPELQWPLPGLSGELIADGVVWAAVGVDPAGPAVQIVVHSESDVAAASLSQAIRHGLDLAAELPQAQQLVDRPEEVLAALKPAQEGNRLVWRIDEQNGHLNQLVERIVVPPIRAVRAARQRAARMNRFKAIAIAMHNYHDGNKAFAPQAIRGGDGKPLLSWRVALLPYLEGNELYGQFRLDEPWDSPHNKQFVARMPEVYADPALAQLAAEGQTTCQVPVHEATVFPPAAEGVPIKEIKDGTSKTIMVVEAPPERAVPWTKPEDWQADPQNPLEGVQRTDREAFIAAYCDGHVEIIAVAIDPQTFWKLLTRAGGEP